MVGSGWGEPSLERRNRHQDLKNPGGNDLRQAPRSLEILKSQNREKWLERRDDLFTTTPMNKMGKETAVFWFTGGGGQEGEASDTGATRSI